MDSKCVFNHFEKCSILSVTDCPKKCSFRKTEEELIASQYFAAERLEKKGLEPVLVHDNGITKMSVRRK